MTSRSAARGRRRRCSTTRDRRGGHPQAHLAGYSGILQADAYDGYNRLYLADRKPGPVKEAACWVHARRPFFAMADLDENARRKAAGKKEIPLSPIAIERSGGALRRERTYEPGARPERPHLPLRGSLQTEIVQHGRMQLPRQPMDLLHQAVGEPVQLGHALAHGGGRRSLVADRVEAQLERRQFLSQLVVKLARDRLALASGPASR